MCKCKVKIKTLNYPLDRWCMSYNVTKHKTYLNLWPPIICITSYQFYLSPFLLLGVMSCNTSWVKCNYDVSNYSTFYGQIQILLRVSHRKYTYHIHTYHGPLPKICGNGVATKVDDAYTQRKYLTYIR